MDDDDKKKWLKLKRVDVWLTADDIEALNLIRFKRNGATKSAAVRAALQFTRLWIEGKLDKSLP
jgi:hypothetical protein